MSALDAAPTARTVSIVEIEGVIQNYAWGSKTAIAEFQGRASSALPEAELWLGTHPRGVARLVGGALPGADLRSFTERELPFLFKLLAADEPLSLQAHPSRAQAEAGFEKEGQEGIPVDAPTRNYRDRNHKPEIICARTEFHALSGFRPPEESSALAEALGLGRELPAFVARLRRGELEAAFRGLFELSRGELRGPITCIGRAAQDSEKLPTEAASVAPWLVELAHAHPADPGVVAALLLHHVRLEPGEAMYLPAGNLHAYLRGVGFELMASSDNVMRGGLTPKHVDVNELCHILEFAPLKPEILSGQLAQVSEGVRACVYRTAATEFELRRVEVQGEGSYDLLGPAIILVESGQIELSWGDATLELKAGRSAFVGFESVARLSRDGLAAIAAVPRV